MERIGKEITLLPKGLGRGFLGLPTLKPTTIRGLAGLEKGKNVGEKWRRVGGRRKSEWRAKGL